MKTIAQYPLLQGQSLLQAIYMPLGARVLCVGELMGQPFLWAEVDDALPQESRTFYVVGTGFAFPPVPARYVGTAILGSGMVLHVYDPSLAPSFS